MHQSQTSLNRLAVISGTFFVPIIFFQTLVFMEKNIDLLRRSSSFLRRISYFHVKNDENKPIFRLFIIENNNEEQQWGSEPAEGRASGREH